MKDNQAQLREDIATLFEPKKSVKGVSAGTKDFRSADRWDQGHGRLEHRALTVSAELQGYSDWLAVANSC